MKNLRELRLKKKLTVKQLADKAGMHMNNIYMVEQGKRHMSVNLAQHVAPVLGCKWHELIEVKEEPK